MFTISIQILGKPPPGVVRAATPLTRWLFRPSTGNNKGGCSCTDISVESTVDSRGNIPVWLVNYIQVLLLLLIILILCFTAFFTSLFYNIFIFIFTF